MVCNDARLDPVHLRMIPPGYLDTVRSGENQLKSESLRKLYERVRLITQSPDLLSPARLRVLSGLH